MLLKHKVCNILYCMLNTKYSKYVVNILIFIMLEINYCLFRRSFWCLYWKYSIVHMWNQKFPYVQAGFRKSRGTRDQMANNHGVIAKVREFQKLIYFCFIDYDKTFDCVDHIKLENLPFFRRWEYQNTLSASWENLYAGQETTVRTRHGTMDWLQIGNGLCQSCILSLCLFNIFKVHHETEGEVVGWHHCFSGHEFEQTLEDSKEKGSLVCCSPWGLK